MTSVNPEPGEQRVKYTSEQADTLREIYFRFAEVGRQELARREAEAEQQRKTEGAALAPVYDYVREIAKRIKDDQQ